MSELHLYTAPAGCMGFDCNQPLTETLCHALKADGWDFAIRYVRRAESHTYDLSAKEAITILGCGLALATVQHVERETVKGWLPARSKGIAYGQTAADEAKKAGLILGSQVFLDLENVDQGVPSSIVIDYCNSWHSVVAGAGYLPGLYVGYNCGLTNDELYRNLRFTHYWGAYNNVRKPSHRGFQLLQRTQLWAPRGAGRPDAILVDPDEVVTDALGGRPVLLAAEGWLGVSA